MTSFTPILLTGDNLGQRHRYLNSLVNEAKNAGINFQDLEALPEESPVDRLFKIDLAIKLKNVDYIIRNLKDDDMLYVSRALKATWLLEHRNIINPKHLEDVLFPEMVMPAVSRMKHWLYINLRDPSMCQEFYQHYKENTFEFAIKFLSHCNNDFIMNEMTSILTKMTTHHLKVLCEKCPKVAKIYFESLATNEEVIKQYLQQEQSYYNSVKCVLKTDADVFLDITEKYFNIHTFSRLSPVATNYIISHHKNRFLNKLELYVAHILHIPTLASRLSVEECKEVVIKLAQANYLQHWFNYKVVEPLIKRLSPDERAAFKKKIFVEKDVGVRVDEWPYKLPTSPIEADDSSHVFDDQEFMPFREHLEYMPRVGMACMARKMQYCSYEADCGFPIKSELDRLFDEFRFVGFDQALHDLGQRLQATGSADRRRDMFLVLVSKSGGRNEALSALLNLAARHSNEPSHTRAAILRSLVKRAHVWRLPADIWQLLLDFGHGLGLDGAAADAACREGFHAVVIRQLLAGQCEAAIRDAFLEDFSTLTEYQLSKEERARLGIGLQNMLMTGDVNETPSKVAARLDKLLDVLKAYHIRIQLVSSIVDAVKAQTLRDAEVAQPLLERLYDARISRRELLRLNLEFRKDEAALLNALRHDPDALQLKRVTHILVTGGSLFDRFLWKLMIYFDRNDFMKELRTNLKDKIIQAKDVKLIRPLASLLGRDLVKALHELDGNKDLVRFAAALRACAHLARPNANIADWGWRKAGVKAVATQAMRCREVEREKLILCALAAERRTVRIALALSMRTESEMLLDTFTAAVKLRRTAALHVALLYFRRYGTKADQRVWDIIKPLISSIDLASREFLRKRLVKTDWIPSAIKPDYCATVYLAIYKISNSNANYIIPELSKLLPKVSEELIETILLKMLENTDNHVEPISFPAIYVRYLMLSRDEEVQIRFEKIGVPFLQGLDTLRCKKDSRFTERLDQTIQSLKYNAAFFDDKHTSCLSVIGRFLDWMQTFMPKEEHFQTYVQIHLTMLYFKAIRQSMKQMPEVFDDPKSVKSEGVDAVGYVFGRYIAKEVAELVDTYFDSIIELYSGGLANYFSEYFMYSKSKAKFLTSVLKGMLAEGMGCQNRLVVYILRKFRYDVDEKVRDEIVEQITKDKEAEFFVHALLCH